MNKNTSLILIRWIIFSLSALIIYILTKIIIDWMANLYIRDVVQDIYQSGELGGHYIIGTYYIFIKEFLSVTLAFSTGIKIAPSNKHLAFFILLGIFILYLIVGSFSIGLTMQKYIWTTEGIIRIIIETLSQASAIIYLGIKLFNNKDPFEE